MQNPGPHEAKTPAASHWYAAVFFGEPSARCVQYFTDRAVVHTL